MAAIDLDQTADTADTEVAKVKGPQQFMFESEVDRIFSTPIGNLVEYLCC